MRLLGMLLITLVVALSLSCGKPAGIENLRFDGVYRAKEEKGPFVNYFRFYPDNKVSWIATGRERSVDSIFSSGFSEEDTFQGKYGLDSEKLTLAVVSDKGANRGRDIECYGTVDVGKLNLTCESSAKKNQSLHRVYDFIEVK